MILWCHVITSNHTVILYTVITHLYGFIWFYRIAFIIEDLGHRQHTSQHVELHLVVLPGVRLL